MREEAVTLKVLTAGCGREHGRCKDLHHFTKTAVATTNNEDARHLVL